MIPLCAITMSQKTLLLIVPVQIFPCFIGKFTSLANLAPFCTSSAANTLLIRQCELQVSQSAVTIFPPAKICLSAILKSSSGSFSTTVSPSPPFPPFSLISASPPFPPFPPFPPSELSHMPEASDIFNLAGAGGGIFGCCSKLTRFTGDPG